MRWGTLLSIASMLALVSLASAQEYAGRTTRAPSSVLRPANTVAWRNHAVVPDGPCGHPMTVQTDCYDVCRPCGPLRPFCFLHRVGRMLDCLIPCNLCCKQGCGGCGSHGCVLGGRKLGHCKVCCGAPSCGGCASACVHPCGSAFESCCTPAGTTGGHCYGCSSALPGLSDPFQDDPMPPKPTPESATEVRRVPVKPARPVAAPSRPSTAATQKASPYKIVAGPATTPARQVNRPAAASNTAAKKSTSQSVLRRASAEQSTREPAPLKVDHARTAPIIRSQSPDAASSSDVPSNPLR